MQVHVPFNLGRHWVAFASVVTSVVALAAAGAIRRMLKHRPTPDQREERRRTRLASLGRIVDGSLVDIAPGEAEPPQTIIYRYRIAGVTYECSQDVSTLAPLVQNLRLDYPVQVRYNHANPADSIVVSETWNGLWTNLWTSTGTHGARTR